MSDITLGKLITEPQQRDAIHIAVAPVVAAMELEPGSHVGIMEDGKAGFAPGIKTIGIVDPFLKKAVFPGDTFWLFMYPKTILNLRHNWEHPELDDFKSKEEAKIWIDKFARNLNSNSYETIMAAAAAYRKDGTMLDDNFNAADYCVEEIGTFWKYYNLITGDKTPESESTFWTCCP